MSDSNKNNSSPKKALLVWAIILFAVGLIGIAGVSTATSPVVYIITCVVFMLVGVLLFFLYMKNKKQITANQIESINIEVKEEKPEVLKEEKTICPYCGAASVGGVCEFCGMRKDK